MHETRLTVVGYDLDATLASGQAFRWRKTGDSWQGVILGRWVEIQSTSEGLVARTNTPVADWRWLVDYLQAEIDIAAVLASFPDDEPMRCATAACRGLWLLRQDPWECLASFILSSTKQIVQIQQIVELLCERFGEPITTIDGRAAWAFPTAARIAAATEAELRACKMGFRAPYLLGTAKIVASGGQDLESLRNKGVHEARAALMELPGVGRKIADCVLLFAYGFPTAFPVDVWVMKALQQLYFPKRKAAPRRLEKFVATYFGPNAGYAQQYLFHYMRTKIE